jgi:hypothetical protein
MKRKVLLYLYALMTVLISSAAFGAHQYAIGFFALGLGMVAIFIYYNYHHPLVQEWVDRWF